MRCLASFILALASLAQSIVCAIDTQDEMIMKKVAQKAHHMQQQRQQRPTKTKKLLPVLSTKYSTAWRNSDAPWDNIDHLVFNTKCTNCNSWAYGKGKGVVFLHMRKAGGTLFLRLLQEWFVGKSCVTLDSRGRTATCSPASLGDGQICEQSTAFGGVHDGVYRTYKKESILIADHCRDIEFRHYEYSCLHGPSIAALPPASQRANEKFSLFTILRDPLERQASQFFFVGPGEKYVKARNLQMCHSAAAPESGVCVRAKTTPKCAECLRHSTEQALSELQSDEAVWLDWMQREQDFGFGERYMPNYYVHKLTSGAKPSVGRAKDREAAVGCFVGNSSACSSDSIDVLSNVALAEYCSARGRNMGEALALAKKILAEQFDFLILELIKTQKHATAQVMGRVFDVQYGLAMGGQKDDKSLSKKPQPGLMRKVNNSHDTTSGMYYQSKMPAAVVKKMKEQNSYDIDLYLFAVDLFRRRFNIPDGI